ncbi:MAG: hypothetical protein AAB345_02855 [Patescibacteria group bacterium]
MSSFSLSGRQLLSVLLSVVISIMAVAFMANAVSYIDADSVGIATSSPGGALGVKGDAHVDGFALANSFNATSSGSIFQWEANDATSTTYAVGIGGFGSVKGDWNVAGTSTISSLYATSTLSVGSSSPDMAFSVIGDSLINGTLGVLNVLDVQGTATSTFDAGLQIDFDTLVVDNNANIISIATTTGTGSAELGLAPELTIGAGSASSSIFVSGGAEVGSALLLKSQDGDGCILITGSQLDADADGTIALVGKVVGCPD